MQNNNRVQEMEPAEVLNLAGSINIAFKKFRRLFLMAKNNEKKAALESFKMQAANEVGVNLKQGYNGDLTSKQAGSVGGQMVKKMVESYENNLKANG